MNTDFGSLVENELRHTETIGRFAEFRLQIMEALSSGRTLEDVSEGVRDMDLVLPLYEAVGKIPPADIKKIEETFNETSVQLMVDKVGNKTFAIRKKDIVVYVNKAAGLEQVMSLTDWKSKERTLRNEGVTFVKDKGAARDFVKFILSTLKWVGITVAAIIVAGALVVAIYTGMTYTAQTGATLTMLTQRYLPHVGAHTNELWALTAGRVVEVGGNWLNGMGTALNSAATVVGGIITKMAIGTLAKLTTDTVINAIKKTEQSQDLVSGTPTVG